jgi:hypothetical protein
VWIATSSVDVIRTPVRVRCRCGRVRDQVALWVLDEVVPGERRVVRVSESSSDAPCLRSDRWISIRIEQ